jgi:hypothetical protein
MKCSSCSETIPFWGVKCPYCGNDKAADQSRFMLVCISPVGCAVIGWFIRGYWGLAAGGILGALAGYGIYKIITSDSKKPKSDSR